MHQQQTCIALNFSSSFSFSRSLVTFALSLSGWCFSACFWYAFFNSVGVAIHRVSCRPSRAYRSLRLSSFLDFFFFFACFHCTLHGARGGVMRTFHVHTGTATDKRPYMMVELVQEHGLVVCAGRSCVRRACSNRPIQQKRYIPLCDLFFVFHPSSLRCVL